MTRLFFLVSMAMLFACRAVIAGETITAQEVDGYFYSDGEMKRSKGQFEITYYMEGDIITRTRVYDLNKKQVIPDNVIYHIQRQLSSDPTKGMHLIGGPIIRAIGQPGADAVEILSIGDTFIQSVRSSGDYFVISRSKRIK